MSKLLKMFLDALKYYIVIFLINLNVACADRLPNPPNILPNNTTSFISITDSTSLSPITIIQLLPSGTFAVKNTNKVSYKVQREHSIEVWWKNKWEKVELVTPYLTNICEKPNNTNQCITIQPGETIKPPRWTGWTCSDRCVWGCSADTSYGPGPYRVVVKSCDGNQTFIGPEFTMTDIPHNPTTSP